MSETPTQPAEAEETIDLKEPAIAALLAWLIPGLGHWYQGRRAKAVLFFLCITSIFAYGVYLGGNREVGWGRTVFFSCRENDFRLYFVGQAGVGAAAIPALVQANRMANHQKVWWHGFMAPPRPSRMDPRDNQNADQPTLSELHRELHHDFELGSVFTLIGGLLNVFAIFDAWGGPVILRPKKDEKKSDDKSDQAKKDEAKTDDAQPKS